MGRALFSIISLVALAVLIVLNIDARTSFNLFGWQFEDIAVPVLAIISFVLGALYSFIFYLLGYFSRSRSRKIAKQREQLKSKEQTVRQQSQQLRREKRDHAPNEGTAASDSAAVAPAPGGHADGSAAGKQLASGAPGPKRSGNTNPLRRFFGASSK